MNFPQEKSIPGISLPFAIYSNIKLCLPAKTNGELKTHANLGENRDGKIRTVNNIDIFTFLCVACSSFLFCLFRFLGLDFSSLTIFLLCAKLSPVIPLCLSTVFIWYSLCFCTSARPCSFTSGPYLSALAMKSHRHDLWPATKPFPQQQPDNKHEYMGAHHCGAVCSCAGACLHNFTFLCVRFLCSSACNPIQNFACASTEKLTADWNRTCSWSHIPTHCSLDFSITSKREFLTFFFYPRLLRVYEPGQDCSSHWSDLLPSHDSWLRGRGDENGLPSLEKLHLFHHMYEHKGLIIYFYMQLIHNWSNSAELDNSLV